jgi:hypothetical protein
MWQSLVDAANLHVGSLLRNFPETCSFPETFSEKVNGKDGQTSVKLLVCAKT